MSDGVAAPKCTNKQTQTLIHCFPHFLKKGEVATVVITHACQTAISVPFETDDINIYTLLEFTPYKSIAHNSLKQLNLPRKALLHWKLPDTQSNSSSSDTLALSDSTHCTTLKSSKVVSSLSDLAVELNKKPSATHTSTLKKSRIYLTAHLQQYHKVMHTQGVQTVLSVTPHVLDNEEVAVVFTDHSIQTSVTCVPDESMSTIVPRLQANLPHQGVVLPESSSTKQPNNVPSASTGVPNVEPLNEDTQEEEIRVTNIADELCHELSTNKEFVEPNSTVVSLSEEVDDKYLTRNNGRGDVLNKQHFHSDNNVDRLFKKAITNTNDNTWKDIQMRNSFSESYDSRNLTCSNCMCGTKKLKRIVDKLEDKFSTLELDSELFPPDIPFEPRIIQVMNTFISLFQSELLKLVQIYDNYNSDGYCQECVVCGNRLTKIVDFDQTDMNCTDIVRRYINKRCGSDRALTLVNKKCNYINQRKVTVKRRALQIQTVMTTSYPQAASNRSGYDAFGDYSCIQNERFDLVTYTAPVVSCAAENDVISEPSLVLVKSESLNSRENVTSSQTETLHQKQRKVIRAVFRPTSCYSCTNSALPPSSGINSTKQPIKSDTILPDLKNRVIRLSVIISKEQPDSEKQFEEILTPALPTAKRINTFICDCSFPSTPSISNTDFIGSDENDLFAALSSSLAIAVSRQHFGAYAGSTLMIPSNTFANFNLTIENFSNSSVDRSNNSASQRHFETAIQTELVLGDKLFSESLNSIASDNLEECRPFSKGDMLNIEQCNFIQKKSSIFEEYKFKSEGNLSLRRDIANFPLSLNKPSSDVLAVVNPLTTLTVSSHHLGILLSTFNKIHMDQESTSSTEENQKVNTVTSGPITITTKCDADATTSSIIVKIKSSTECPFPSQKLRVVEYTESFDNPSMPKKVKSVDRSATKLNPAVKGNRSSPAVCQFNTTVKFREGTKIDQAVSQKLILISPPPPETNRSVSFRSRLTSFEDGVEYSGSENPIDENEYKEDPIGYLLRSYEAEMRPLRRALTQLQQKIQNLNMPELDAIMKSSSTSQENSSSRSIFPSSVLSRQASPYNAQLPPKSSTGCSFVAGPSRNVMPMIPTYSPYYVPSYWPPPSPYPYAPFAASMNPYQQPIQTLLVNNYRDNYPFLRPQDRPTSIPRQDFVFQARNYSMYPDYRGRQYSNERLNYENVPSSRYVTETCINTGENTQSSVSIETGTYEYDSSDFGVQTRRAPKTKCKKNRATKKTLLMDGSSSSHRNNATMTTEPETFNTFNLGLGQALRTSPEEFLPRSSGVKQTLSVGTCTSSHR